MRLLKVLLFVSAGLGATAALGQSFNSGSNGSFGPINVAASQTLVIPLPPDGIIHATTVTLGSNSVLRFTRNEKNTPVYLLATGDVEIAGTIDVSGGNPTSVAGGIGGPGGFDGGVPGIAGSPGGDGLGPGGGRAGAGSGATVAGGGSYGSRNSCTNCGEIYGSQLMFPMLGGSGGGARTDASNQGGGGGGGALLLASSTRVSCNRNFCIDASGGVGSGFLGGGSGGAVRVVAPRIDGTGSVITSGGSSVAGSGRVRFDLIDRSGFGSVSFSSVAATVGAYMQTFPSTTIPRLDFTNVAGTDIPDGSDSVTLILPFDAPAAQTITLRARDFTGVVPVRVVLTPVSGSRIVVDDTIDMAGQTSATKVINVTVPQNVAMRVNAWTR